MSKTRALVTGKYLKKGIYVLYNEDGSEFQVIREGEAFTIEKQLTPWYPIRVKKKNGKGTILVCQKFGDDGTIIDEFPLIHNKTGLWALTSRAARNGVFHNYNIPTSELEKQLALMGFTKKIITSVPEIDVQLELGGQLCHHCNRNFGYVCITDGTIEKISLPAYASRKNRIHKNKNCMISTYYARVYNATYVIYYSVGTYSNGCRHNDLERIILTKDADESLVTKKLAKI